MALAAKVLVFAVVSLITAEVTTFAGFLIGQALLTSPAPHATLSSPGALQAVAGTGLFLCVIGLFALGLATIVRHTAGAIGAYVFVVLVLPFINQSLPSSVGDKIHRFLPLTMGGAMSKPSAVPHAFGPWTGFAILCGYAVLPLVLGTVLLVWRDA